MFGVVKVANVDDEESSDGGDEDQASPSRRCSQGEFRSTSSFEISLSSDTNQINTICIINCTFVRKHKTEIRKLKKELLEIRHTEVAIFHHRHHLQPFHGDQVPRKGRGFEHESRIMDMNHELRRFTFLLTTNLFHSPREFFSNKRRTEEC